MTPDETVLLLVALYLLFVFGLGGFAALTYRLGWGLRA